MSIKAVRIVTSLFEAFIDDVRILPDEARERVTELESDDGQSGRARAIADYIAGMTDRFAIAEHERIFNPSLLT